MIRGLAHRLGLTHCPECEVLVEFAMEGLPEDQRDKVRRHLSDCPPCREQVRDYLQVGEALGLCAEEREAPPGLCDKVLARLGEDPSSPPCRSAALVGGWPRFWMVLGPAFAALGLAMTLVALAALARLKAPQNGGGAALVDGVRAVLDDPRAVRVRLGAVAGRAGSGVLVVAPDKDRAYLRCAGLAPNPVGGSYVLWQRAAPGAAPRPLASFTVDRPGTNAYLLGLDAAPVGGEFLVSRQDGPRVRGVAFLEGSARP